MRILIAGGGTGGHIYPALAIAKALQELEPKIEIEFVGTPAGLEAKLIPRAGYKIHFIPIGRLNNNVSIAERIKTVLQLPWAVVKGFLLVLRLRPQAVIGVGGYASAPVVLAAALLKYPTFIWEPNAYPGMANRYLSKFVDSCLVVFAGAAKFLKNKNVTRVHMPIRAEIESLSANPNTEKLFHVLVFGGSQGARGINNALLAAVQSGGGWLNGTKIVHQTGPADFARIQFAYANTGYAKDHVEVLEYLHDMPERYQWADMVVARAGTGTISELAAAGKPAILIPLPTAADDHQTKNAEALVEIGGASLLPQKELTPERLIQEIVSFKKNNEKRKQMAQNIQKFHRPGAAHEIARLVLKK